MQLSYAGFNAIHYLEAFIKAIKASVSFHEEGYVLALVFLPCYLL